MLQTPTVNYFIIQPEKMYKGMSNTNEFKEKISIKILKSLERNGLT